MKNKFLYYLTAIILIFSFPLHSAWLDVNKNLQDQRNVSDNWGPSYVPDIEFDSYGYPHIVWFDETNGGIQVFYLKWNGYEFVDADGIGRESIQVSTTLQQSKYPKIELDSTNTPHIVWEEINAWPNSDIYGVKWNGTSWVDMDGVGVGNINISNSATPSGHPDMVISLDDVVHVVWQEGDHEVTLPNPANINYLKFNGATWVDADGVGQGEKEVFDTPFLSLWASIDFDSSNNIHITWSDDDDLNREIYYLRWDGAAWVDGDGTGQGQINISLSPQYSAWSNLDVDINDDVHVVWEDVSDGFLDVFYLKNTSNIWLDADGIGRNDENVTISHNNSSVPRVRTDSLGIPHIVHCEGALETSEVYCRKWSTGSNSWTDETGTGTAFTDVSNNYLNSSWAMMELDPDGYPNIVWSDGDLHLQHDIHYLRWAPEGAATYTPTITMTSTYDALASITPTRTITFSITPTISPTNTPTVTRTVSSFPFATSTPDICWTDADGVGQGERKISVGKDSVMKIDAAGNAHLCWESGGGIYYLQWNGTSWVDADGLGQESVKISGSVINSAEPDMKLDAAGRPHISWAGGTYIGWQQVYYMQWNGTGWVDVDGVGQESITIASNATSFVGAPEGVSISLDGLGNPHIAWSDYYEASTWNAKDIHYLQWTGLGWADVDGVGLESAVISDHLNDSKNPCIAVDNSGNVHVAWIEYESSNTTVRFEMWDGADWSDPGLIPTGPVDIVADSSLNNAANVDMVLDGGVPHITWDDYSSGSRNICYLKWNVSSWTDVNGIDQSQVVIHNTIGDSVRPSIDLGCINLPNIAWSDADGIYYLKWNTASWVDVDGDSQERVKLADNASSGGKVSLQIDQASGNKPHIAWNDDISGGQENYYLRYVCDSSCTTPTPTHTGTSTMTVTPTITITSTFYVTSTYTQTVTPTPTNVSVDLKISKKGRGADPKVGVHISYEIRVSNPGPVNATSLVVWDTLPPELSFVSDLSGYPCFQTGNYIRWEIPTSLNVGDMIIINFVARIDSLSVGSLIINIAGVDYNDLLYDSAKHPPIFSEMSLFPEGRVVVYPNPFNYNNAIGGMLKFLNTVPGSLIQIYTVSGELVTGIKCDSVLTLWDCTNRFGNKVSSGIYYYIIKNPDSDTYIKGKIYIISTK